MGSTQSSPLPSTFVMSANPRSKSTAPCPLRPVSQNVPSRAASDKLTAGKEVVAFFELAFAVRAEMHSRADQIKALLEELDRQGFELAGAVKAEMYARADQNKALLEDLERQWKDLPKDEMDQFVRELLDEHEERFKRSARKFVEDLYGPTSRLAVMDAKIAGARKARMEGKGGLSVLHAINAEREAQHGRAAEIVELGSRMAALDAELAGALKAELGRVAALRLA